MTDPTDLIAQARHLRYAATLSIVAFFALAVAAFWVPFKVVMPLLVMALVFWVVFGSVSRRSRAQQGEAE
jgi:predicted RND superfamily exporter protein